MEDVFLGVDPDMHFVCFWIVNGRGYPLDRYPIELPTKLKGRDALMALADSIHNASYGIHRMMKPYHCAGAAVESQELYQFGESKTKNPKSIMQLATAAGMILAEVRKYTENIYFPAPQAWKGSVPKGIHQARICSRVEWKYEQVGGRDGYCQPKGLQECLDMRIGSQWKHAMDSIGLALYAREIWTEKQAFLERQKKGSAE